MRLGRSSWFAVVAISTILLSGCGLSDSQNKQTAVPSSVGSSSSDADITSGCWRAADRGPAKVDNGAATQQQWNKEPEMVISDTKTYTATIATSSGSIDLELFPKDAPNTVNSFVCLAKAGYFDGTPVHRIVKDFVIQGGDPTGTGTGGPGYRFNDEPITRDYVKGTLAMANSGLNTNGSQFFICTADLTGNLDKAYTIFGQVTGGMEVVDLLNSTPTRSLGTGAPASTPIDPVMITSVTITEA